MCGINGIFAYSERADLPDRDELIATRDHMRRRGPDAAGEWWSEDRRFALGHRRLSIIDLSDRSNQPMLSHDGQLAIVFNGEIYNLPELRQRVEARGCILRTTSDTEILLHLYAVDGESMLNQLRGMFAFAIWDNRRRRLFLARDPFGIKPLYISDDGTALRFASQVKALLAGGRVERDHDPAGAVGFFLWGSVPDPFTLYRPIKALPAGHFLCVSEGKEVSDTTPFASLAAELAKGARAPITAAEIPQQVQRATLESIKAHLLADVEVGLFLSAGIDSGAILGLMTDAGARRVQTITLGFESFTGTHDDEVPLAAKLARHYGANHNVRRVSQKEFEEDLPAIFDAMDQPSIDGVNTWFVAKAAREIGLKVALSGLGGDELLAGYPSFSQVPRVARALAPLSRIPVAGKLAEDFLGKFAARRPKLAGLFEYGGSFEGAYLLRRGLFLPSELENLLEPALVAEGLMRLDTMGQLRASCTPDPGSDVGRISAMECSTYTRHQLLRDADWAGMAHSLEIRTPLLDVQLLRDLAPALPQFRGLIGKRALAAAPSRSLPEAVIERGKSGFAVPTGHWMHSAARTHIGGVTTKGLSSRAWAQAVYEAQSQVRLAEPAAAWIPAAQ